MDSSHTSRSSASTLSPKLIQRKPCAKCCQEPVGMRTERYWVQFGKDMVEHIPQISLS